MAPSEQCFYCRLSPCVGFASFTELDLKETWNILVALSTVRIQFLVFVFFFLALYIITVLKHSYSSFLFQHVLPLEDKECT